ncbi:MAG: Stp1/IreP family PP2C-type Ser/Thr phosphatase [Acidobacteria bacterium]|nr:Stp1/IreP family PP2C-type Ser/Thr phosphatase [Acidobacteriota bacterium]
MMSTADISVSAFGLTDIGLRRKTNEDAFLMADLSKGERESKLNTGRLDEQGVLLVVADGMGGTAAGEIASSMAVTTMCDELMKGANDRSSSAQLKRASERANENIWNYAQAHKESNGMGTTITAALVRDGVAYLSQVGDSRAYLIRGRSIRQITRDQSLVQNMLDSGLLTPEEAARHPYRNVILQALGVKQTVEAALSAIALCDNDYLLLCSDGLSNKVSLGEMQRVVMESETTAYACHLLTEIAKQRGGEDNITVIVAQFCGGALRDSNEEVDTKGLKINARAA